MPTSYPRQAMADEMCAMAYMVDGFARLYNAEITGPCFMERCYRLAHTLNVLSALVESIDELPFGGRVSAFNIFNVFADQMGRLTLHGYDYVDGDAMVMVEKAKSETYFYYSRIIDPQCAPVQEKLAQYWNYLHWFKPNCGCHNCK